MKPVKVLKLKQVNGTEVTPSENLQAKEAPRRESDTEVRSLPAPGSGAVMPEVEKPLPPAPPHIGKPVGDPPALVPAPDGFDALFAMALKLRSNGKPGMADYWAQMAQADALGRIAHSFERLNEFLGVYDADDEAHPEAEPTRFADILTDALLSVDEARMEMMPELVKKATEATKPEKPKEKV